MSSKQLSEFGVECWRCKKEYTVLADERDVCDWQDGVLIQEALPYLSAGDRELLISATCDPCFHRMFPE